ncbi:MAG: ATPase [Marinosulfonomonas sp.]|nr:ATPase [Marinosulfonomonas sp.]
MSEWKAKRFWSHARSMPKGDGYQILLDDREVKTPGRVSLIVPTSGLAKAIAAEWDAQTDQINPDTMPFTRTANSALDKVTVQFCEVAEMIAAYGDSDLLCYRAESPKELVDRQSEKWDPLLDWAADELGVRLKPVTGVVHQAQSDANNAALLELVNRFDCFELAAFHDLVSLSGSLIIGFAAAHRVYPADLLWDTSRIDENWQIEHWGQDDEATTMANQKRSAFQHAAAFLALCHKTH